MDVRITQVLRILLQELMPDPPDGGCGCGPGGPGPGGPGGGPGGPGGPSPGGGTFDPGPNDELKPLSGGIQSASNITGLDPNLIGAVVWAESRGNPNESSINSDGNTDKGPMQISQERYDEEVVPNLSAEERQKIKQETGLEAERLDMDNPEHNIIGGSLELSHKIKEKGSVEAGLSYYVNGGNPDIGSPNYVQNVLQYWRELANGQRLSEDPHGP
jgi:hypothetical protein